LTDGQTDIPPLAIPAVCIARYANALVKIASYCEVISTAWVNGSMAVTHDPCDPFPSLAGTGLESTTSQPVVKHASHWTIASGVTQYVYALSINTKIDVLE